MKHMKFHHWILAACIIACAFVAHGCSALKRGAWTGGGAASGAAVGSLAGPAGTVAGAAVGGIAGQAIGENQELRDGDLIGEGAAKVIYRNVPVPTTPSWLWLAALGAFLWLKGHHLIELVRGGGLDAILKLFALKRTISKPRQVAHDKEGT